MAKMFYTLEETKAALGKSEDDIRQLVKDAQLREFRDGPRLMFKADQVETLKGQLGGAPAPSEEIQLSDTGAPLGLADSKTGSGTGIAFPVADTPTPPLPVNPPSLGSGSGTLDVGLSGSMGGSMGGASLAGSIGGASMPGMGAGATKTPAKAGLNVFGDETEENVDPMAQTHIAPARDQISLEGVGSGSGLLDLTRETDDTSLGAALLDEISPGGGGKRAPAVSAPASSGSTAGMPVPELEPSAIIEDRTPAVYGAAPVYVTAPDPLAPAFVGAAIGALLVVLVGALVLINGIVDTNPFVDARFAFVAGIGAWNSPLAMLFVGGLVAVILFFVGGLLVGKMGNRQTA